MDAGPKEGSTSFRTTTTGTPPSEVPALRRVPFVKLGDVLGEKVRLGELLFGTINSTGYELFRYLETLGETKVIASPRLLVTEGTEARILVGTREAYITTTTTTGQTTSTTAEEIEFIDVGIQLAVTPHINADGYITLKVKPEVSSVVRQLETPSGNKIPIVDTSTSETTVLVKDGATVVMGGLRKNQEAFSNDQIPFLGRIPLLGELFRQRDKDDETQELVVFITPHIVEGDLLVTGDEVEFGGGIKDFKGYPAVMEEGGAPPEWPSEPALPEPPVSAPAPLPPTAQRKGMLPMKLFLREESTGYAGAD
jgi:type II secretory pathway component HofQ